ncbi:MAG TPA: RNA 2',3'-cyclic phosphodiesterase [Candidatus Angelobacter sp.]
MRIFIALDIPGEVRARMAEYAERVRQYASEARWSRVEGLHLTLKFVGEVKDEKLIAIKNALATVRAGPFAVTFASAGFFPTPRAPRVFWIGVEAGEELSQLAASIEGELEKLGIAREQRAFSPHLTLARAGTNPGSLKGLAPLLEREAPPQFGTMTAREFWLYRSELGRGGSKYTKLERYGLG